MPKRPEGAGSGPSRPRPLNADKFDGVVQPKSLNAGPRSTKPNMKVVAISAKSVNAADTAGTVSASLNVIACRMGDAGAADYQKSCNPSRAPQR